MHHVEVSHKYRNKSQLMKWAHCFMNKQCIKKWYQKMVKCLVIFSGQSSVIIFQCQYKTHLLLSLETKSPFYSTKMKWGMSCLVEEPWQKEGKKGFWILRWLMNMRCPKTCPSNPRETIIYCPPTTFWNLLTPSQLRKIKKTCFAKNASFLCRVSIGIYVVSMSMLDIIFIIYLQYHIYEITQQLLQNYCCFYHFISIYDLSIQDKSYWVQ